MPAGLGGLDDIRFDVPGAMQTPGGPEPDPVEKMPATRTEQVIKI